MDDAVRKRVSKSVSWKKKIAAEEQQGLAFLFHVVSFQFLFSFG